MPGKVMRRLNKDVDSSCELRLGHLFQAAGLGYADEHDQVDRAPKHYSQHQ